MRERDDFWIGLPCWGCAAFAAAGVIVFLALRVFAGFGLNPRYGLGFDDGGPIYYLFAMGIVPTAGIGIALSWHFHRRASMFANLIVLGFFLGYGALGGPWFL